MNRQRTFELWHSGTLDLDLDAFNQPRKARSLNLVLPSSPFPVETNQGQRECTLGHYLAPEQRNAIFAALHFLLMQCHARWTTRLLIEVGYVRIVRVWGRGV